jgi:hypothetical protein
VLSAAVCKFQSLLSAACGCALLLVEREEERLVAATPNKDG